MMWTLSFLQGHDLQQLDLFSILKMYSKSITILSKFIGQLYLPMYLLFILDII